MTEPVAGLAPAFYKAAAILLVGADADPDLLRTCEEAIAKIVVDRKLTDPRKLLSAILLCREEFQRDLAQGGPAIIAIADGRFIRFGSGYWRDLQHEHLETRNRALVSVVEGISYNLLPLTEG